MRKVKYDFITVDSQAIQSMRYYKDQRNLLVKFQNDTNYLYKDIPVKMFQKLRNSYSIGKFFNMGRFYSFQNLGFRCIGPGK